MLEYRETTRGSFGLWGTSFRYDYSNRKRVLTVSHTDTEKLLAQFNFDKSLSKSPLLYAKLLDKATQINALMVSNNRTVDLANTMELRHLRPLIESLGGISRHAYDLSNLSLSNFCEEFADEFQLKSVKIKYFQPNDDGNAFFIARIQTRHDNGICVRACTLSGLTAAMADRTMRDLITMEFGLRMDGSAQNLLTASSRLSSLSLILDESFIPSDKVIGEKAGAQTQNQS